MMTINPSAAAEERMWAGSSMQTIQHKSQRQQRQPVPSASQCNKLRKRAATIQTQSRSRPIRLRIRTRITIKRPATPFSHPRQYQRSCTRTL